MLRRSIRKGTTLLELLIVLGIIALLAGLAMAAVQKARGAAAQLTCKNNLKQIGLALHQFHDTSGVLPPGVTMDVPGEFNHLSWRVRLMPFLEQQAFWQECQREYANNPAPNIPPFHQSAAVPFSVFACPSDSRVDTAKKYAVYDVALSSYLGVTGTDFQKNDGSMYCNSRTSFGQIRDGLSNTLLVGERPPSNDYRYGWLYFGTGQAFSGSLDHHLGVREIAMPGTGCPAGPHTFQGHQLGVPCGFVHYWSLHPGGAHFAMADGSVHFLSYSADSLMPALATRHGAEAAVLP